MTGNERFRLIHGQDLSALDPIPDQSVDAIVTDPPYASTGDAASIMRTSGGGLSVPKETQFYEAWLREQLRAWVRVLKPSGAIWFTIDWRGAMICDAACGKIGLRPPHVGVWYRGGLGMGYLMRRVYECFVMIALGDFDRQTMAEPDLWECKWTPSNRSGEHSAEKPIPLMERAINLVSPRGGVILDPFCGSGTTGVAALRQGRTFIGIERESEYLDIARRRIEAETTGRDWKRPEQEVLFLGLPGENK